MPTYIVESYATDSAVGDQRVRAARAASVGPGITYIRTTIVPGDQTVLHLFEVQQGAIRIGVSTRIGKSGKIDFV